MQEFVTLEITHRVLDHNLLIFGTIKEGIMEMEQECLVTYHVRVIELLYDRLGDFWPKIVAGQLGMWTPSFREFLASGSLIFLGTKGPIASRRWIADMENARRVSFCPVGAKVGFTSCLLRDLARDW